MLLKSHLFSLPSQNEYTYMLFYFLLSIYMVKKVLFLGQFFEIEFLLFLHVLRSPESENQVFSGLSVCVCVCVCVCYQHNSKTNNSSKTKLGIPN